jgi:hypothetical protein
MDDIDVGAGCSLAIVGPDTYIGVMNVRIMRTFLACSTVLLVLGHSTWVAADEAAKNSSQAALEPAAIATASATSYTPIPAGSALDVSTAATSKLASDAVELTGGTLKQSGYNISRDAPFAMDVIAVLVRGVGQDEGASLPTQGSVRGDQYNNADKNPAGDPLTRGNLFDNQDGAFLSPAQPQHGGHLLRVSLAVYDRKSGLYVWRGQIERDSLDVDIDSSMQQMVPALLAHFGQSLAPTEVPLK